MVSKLFRLLLLLSPICVGMDLNLDMFDIVVFRTGVLCLFGATLFDKPKRTIPEWIKQAVLGLMAICTANLFIHNFAPLVLHEHLNLCLACIGFCVVYAYWDDKENISKPILLAAFINLALFISQRLGFDPVFNKLPYKGQEGAFLGNAPRFITYWALITPFLPLPLLIISLILGIYTSQYCVFIPIALVLLYRAKNKRERIGLIIIYTLSAILLWHKIAYSLMFRFNIAWKPALDVFFDKPLIGIGLGFPVFPELDAIGNSYLQFIIGVGIIGLVWFYWVFKQLVKNIALSYQTIALVSLASLMLIEYPLEIMRSRFTIIAIIIMALLKHHKEQAI